MAKKKAKLYVTINESLGVFILCQAYGFFETFKGTENSDVVRIYKEIIAELEPQYNEVEILDMKRLAKQINHPIK